MCILEPLNALRVYMIFLYIWSLLGGLFASSSGKYSSL